MGSKEIFALRQQKQSSQALALARQEFSNPENQKDIWFIRAYAWSLYDHIKPVVESFEQKEISGIVLSQKISPYMREFSSIAEPLRKELCFSQFLNLANKASKGWNEFLLFAKWAGLESFSIEDKQPFITQNGDKIDSLQTRFLRAIARETQIHQTALPLELLEWGKTVIEYAITITPNDQWLYLYQSRLYLAEGDIDTAIRFLMPVMHKQAKSSWAWALLGDILNHKQSEHSLVCYLYACQVAREEQELAKIRIILAKKLIEYNRFAEASYQIKKALEYRSSHNINVPDDLNILQNQEWYKIAIQNNTLQKSDDVKDLAQAIVMELNQSNVTHQTAVIEHHNKEKALCYVLTSINEGFPLYYDKFPEISHLKPGTVINISIPALGKAIPLAYEISEQDEIQELCQFFIGELNKPNEKDFAFIETEKNTIFVSPPLAKKYKSNKNYKVKCKAIRSKDKRGKIGWKALEIEKI